MAKLHMSAAKQGNGKMLESLDVGLCLQLVLAALLLNAVLSQSAAAQSTSITVLHTFTGNSGDGYAPFAPVILSPNGTLYGTTYGGGDLSCPQGQGGGCGVIYQETFAEGTWFYSDIYEFKGADDEYYPTSTLTLDSQGRLYGVVQGNSFGKIFRLTPGLAGTPWQFSILYTFQNQGDGASPQSPLYIDSAGAIYGVASAGGSSNCANGCGVVFQISPPPTPGGAWTEKTLHTFTGVGDAADPVGILRDSTGVIYGSAFSGGDVNSKCQSGCGAVFRLMPPQTGTNWTYSVLTTFHGQPDGAFPSKTLVREPSGVLYGIQYGGGTNGGTAVFKLTPPAQGNGMWTRTIAYSYAGSATVLDPGASGVLYSVLRGDMDLVHGNVSQLTPKASGGFDYKLLYDFINGPSQNPLGVVLGPGSVLYGTLWGGFNDGGAVFSLP